MPAAAVLRATVYLIMTPFLEDAGGGAQETETVVPEMRVVATFSGAALGTRIATQEVNLMNLI